MAYNLPLRDRIKSEEIRNKWNVEEMIDDIQNYQLKRNQHVLRMPANRIPCKALQYRPKEKRYSGRPYRRWKDQFMLLKNGNWTQNCDWKQRKNNIKIRYMTRRSPWRYTSTSTVIFSIHAQCFYIHPCVDLGKG